MKTTKAGRIDMILCCEPYGDDEQSPICAQGIRYLIHDITELERKLDTCSKAMSSVLWIDECRCDEAYTKRGRCAPNTRCGELDPLREALASIQAAPTNPVDETESSGV